MKRKTSKPAKRSATKKAAKKSPDLSRVESGALLMAESGAQISAQDCAAFSVLMFSRGDAPDEWKKLGTEAMMRFAEFGWAAYHAMGGLSVNWDGAAAKMLEKFNARWKEANPAKETT